LLAREPCFEVRCISTFSVYFTAQNRLQHGSGNQTDNKDRKTSEKRVASIFHGYENMRLDVLHKRYANQRDQNACETEHRFTEFPCEREETNSDASQMNAN